MEVRDRMWVGTDGSRGCRHSGRIGQGEGVGREWEEVVSPAVGWMG